MEIWFSIYFLYVKLIWKSFNLNLNPNAQPKQIGCDRSIAQWTVDFDQKYFILPQKNSIYGSCAIYGCDF